MPLFYFNMDDGREYRDLMGSELADLDAARVEAIRRTGDMLRSDAVRFWRSRGWKVIVTDADGLIMFTLNFLAVSSPATEHYASRLSGGENLQDFGLPPQMDRVAQARNN